MFDHQLLVLLAAIAHRNHFFCLYQQNKSSESKTKFRQASNHCKRVLEAARLVYTNKKKRVFHFLETCNSVLKKGKFALHPLFNSPEVLFSVSDKVKLLRMFLGTLTLMTQVSL